ncbi:MAG: transporter substrate-binding domain-containing protein [Clostridia bacterium]|nr:transporter substrate-binding domain-containing protein [Clostridia bacterium]
MKKTIRPVALLLAFCLLFLLCACGSGDDTAASNGKYRTLETFEDQTFAIGFRNDDFVRYYVEAAIKELAADGTIHNIAVQWFSEDATTFESDSEALDRIGDIPGRTLIIGLDEDAFPMSYADGNGYSGFDVDVARAVCGKLGWDIKFIPINSADAYVELSSGNIDCAWGGLSLDTETSDYTVLPSYMTNSLVLIVRSDSGINSKGRLSGKTLAIDVAAKYIDVLNSDADLKDSLGQVTRLTGGAQACFEALDSGEADAIIVYSVAARYYGK